MQSIRRIREDIFHCNQTEFARIAGVSQGTVSRWQAGLQRPLAPALKRIRDYALTHRIPWDDAWFFEDRAA